MDTYSFEVVIGFRVQADNKHDALQGALAIESSLNSTSIRASYGKVAVVRSKAPLLRRMQTTKRAMPEEPVERSVKAETDRRRKLLDPLTTDWRVRLAWRGTDYEYSVSAPTREQAIEAARIKCYHETSHLGTSLVSVKETA